MNSDFVNQYLKQNRLYPDGRITNQEMIDIMRLDGIVKDNLYQEIEMTSKFVDTHEDISFSRDELPLHSHAFYELIYCCSGNVQYLLGTERYRIQRGDVLIIPPSTSHRPLYLEHLIEPYRRYLLWISPQFMQETGGLWPALPDACISHALLRTVGTEWEYLSNLFRRGIEENSRRDIGWQACIYGNTIVLVANLLRALRGVKTLIPIPEKHELLDDAIVYIESHLSEKITLADTARHFSVSESTISQTFRQKMDVSFYHYVTQRRLISAKEQILDGALLDDVGQQVGFSDYSTFYRAFKREYGVSPLQYRKMQSPRHSS